MNREESTEAEFGQTAHLLDTRRIHPRGARQVASAVSRIISLRGLGQRQAGGELQDAWREAAGTEWRERTKPGALRRGSLEVFCPDSMTLQEAAFRKTELLAALRARLPQAAIRDLKFRVDPQRFTQPG